MGFEGSKKKVTFHVQELHKLVRETRKGVKHLVSKTSITGKIRKCDRTGGETEEVGVSLWPSVATFIIYLKDSNPSNPSSMPKAGFRVCLPWLGPKQPRLVGAQLLPGIEASQNVWGLCSRPRDSLCSTATFDSGNVCGPFLSSKARVPAKGGRLWAPMLFLQ